MSESQLYRKNLSFLKNLNPLLAQRVVKFQDESCVEVLLAKSHHIVPVLGSVSLHSRYDPVKEAQGLVGNIEGLEKSNCVVLGLGFGYHLKEVLNKSPKTLTVVEPSLDLFKRFLEAIDLDQFKGQIEFIVGESPAHIASVLEVKDSLIVEHPASVRLQSRFFDRLKKGIEGVACIENNSLRVLVVPPIYGGSLPTAQFCFDALKDLGHQPFWVNCDKYADAFFDMQKCSGNKEHEAVLSRKFLEYLSEMIVAKAAETRPDIILALAQAPLDKETVCRLKDLGAPIAFWFVEDFRTLSYWEEMAPAYDSFFTIQKGEFFSKLESIESPPFYYLPQACHPSVHRPLELRPIEKIKFGSKLSFMGAAYYNRTQLFSQLLNYDFKIWGTGWDVESIYGPCLQNAGERVSTEDTVKIYNASLINLNLHSSGFHEAVNPKGDFVNPRTFEIAACGGFQLVDERSELIDLFEIGKELIVFKNGKELKEKIDHYLASPSDGVPIAKASKIRVLEEHTFSRRMKEMLVQIYIDHEDKVTRNLKRYLSQWEELLDQAEKGSDLYQFLKRHEGNPNLNLEKLCDDIQEGEGDLSDTELLILMVDQVVKK